MRERERDTGGEAGREMKRERGLLGSERRDGRSESRDRAPTLPVGRKTSGFNSDERRRARNSCSLFTRLFCTVSSAPPPVRRPINNRSRVEITTRHVRADRFLGFLDVSRIFLYYPGTRYARFA